jgi:hypothetical protein
LIYDFDRLFCIGGVHKDIPGISSLLRMMGNSACRKDQSILVGLRGRQILIYFPHNLTHGAVAAG